MATGGASPNWVVLFGWPSTANLDRMKAGGHHFQWNSELGARIYLIPRRGTDTTKIKSFVWPVNSMSEYEAVGSITAGFTDAIAGAHVGAVFERNGKVFVTAVLMGQSLKLKIYGTATLIQLTPGIQGEHLLYRHGSRQFLTCRSQRREGIATRGRSH